MTKSDLEAYFTLEPDWSNPVELNHIWLTGIQRSILGREKRSAYSSRYRFMQRFKIFAYTYEQLAWVNRQFMVNQHKIWGMPIWPDIQEMTAAFSIGAGAITVPEITYRHFKINGMGILISKTNFKTFEVFDISNIVGKQLTLGSLLLKNWTIGDYVLPLFAAHLEKSITTSSVTAELATFTIEALETIKGATS